MQQELEVSEAQSCGVLQMERIRNCVPNDDSTFMVNSSSEDSSPEFWSTLMVGTVAHPPFSSPSPSLLLLSLCSSPPGVGDLEEEAVDGPAVLRPPGRAPSPASWSNSSFIICWSVVDKVTHTYVVCLLHYNT